LITANREREELNQINLVINQGIAEIEQFLLGGKSLESLLNDIKSIQQSVLSTQQGVKQHAIVTKEVESKVINIDNGIKTIHKVLNSLNSIVHEDILIQLARTQRGVVETAEEVRGLGENYKEIRSGGIINNGYNN
jgi:hypothetical protein